MGRAQLPLTMNAITFLGLFFCFSLLVGPTLSIQCYQCTGLLGGQCNDANPGTTTDCSTFATDYCLLSKIGDVETRSCGAGNLASTGNKEGCEKETIDGVKTKVASAKLTSAMKLGRQLVLHLCIYHHL